MIQTLARVTIRRNGEKDDLILGGMMAQSDLLKSGRIYEIVEVLGELVIKDVGPSSIKSPEEKGAHFVNWGKSIDNLINQGLGYSLLTEEQYEELTNDRT